jgi:membrane fusion protein (multidrug efflux system)
MSGLGVSEVPQDVRSAGTWRWLRLLRLLGMAVVFVGGITYLMMVLAGVFEPKVGVPATAAPEGVKQRRLGPGQAVEEVRLVRRPRQEAAVGTVRAVQEVFVASKILARVVEVRVKAGQAVEAGEVLVVLDDADLKARLEQAQAAEQAAAARLEQARIDFDRGKRLQAKQAIPQADFERLATEYRAAAAELERARQAVREAEIFLDYATVRAPIEGTIVDKRVNAGDTVTPGQVLVTMYNPKNMQMIATVRESLAQRLSVGQRVPARLDTLDLQCEGTISEIVPEAQAESRTFQVKVTGPCPPNVYSGMFGRIFIPLEDEEVVVIPERAVLRVGQLEMVDVVENGLVHRRHVQLGRELEEGREVLSGLKPGEQVVVAPKSGGSVEGARS